MRFFTMTLKEIIKHAKYTHDQRLIIRVSDKEFQLVNSNNEVIASRSINDDFTHYFVDKLPFYLTEYHLEGEEYDENDENPLIDAQFELYKADEAIPKCVHIDGHAIIV